MKTCLITGASRGIGRELAVILAKKSEYGRLIVNCRQNDARLRGDQVFEFFPCRDLCG